MDSAEAAVEAMERRLRSYDPARQAKPAREPARSPNFPAAKLPGATPKVVPVLERIKGKERAWRREVAVRRLLRPVRAALEAAWILWTGEEGALWWASKIVRPAAGSAAPS